MTHLMQCRIQNFIHRGLKASRQAGSQIRKKGFGSRALKVHGRIFAMMSSKDKLVVKLPKERIDELIASGQGERFETRPGKPIKEWITVAADGVSWVEIAKEAYEFVRSSNR